MSQPDKVTERVDFRMILMPCCQHMFCNVNSRWPSYCPNCGQFVFDKVKSCAVIHDSNATLKYTPSRN